MRSTLDESRSIHLLDIPLVSNKQRAVSYTSVLEVSYGTAATIVLSKQTCSSLKGTVGKEQDWKGMVSCSGGNKNEYILAKKGNWAASMMTVMSWV